MKKTSMPREKSLSSSYPKRNASKEGFKKDFSEKRTFSGKKDSFDKKEFAGKKEYSDKKDGRSRDFVKKDSRSKDFAKKDDRSKDFSKKEGSDKYSPKRSSQDSFSKKSGNEKSYVKKDFKERDFKDKEAKGKDFKRKDFGKKEGFAKDFSKKEGFTKDFTKKDEFKKAPRERKSFIEVSDQEALLNAENLKGTKPYHKEILPALTLETASPLIQEACARAGWNELMPVQANSIPYIVANQDLMIQSRTGSGKTGAYLLAALTQIEASQKTCQILILVPTRELAIQVETEAKTLIGDTGVRVACLYGGVSYAKQHDSLQRGSQIVVGTPGRILDHLLRGTLNLSTLKFLVFDEADRMLSIGFYPDMKEIQKYLPKTGYLSSLFSATYPPHVMDLSDEFLKDPQMITLSQRQVHVATSQHYYCLCGSMEKDRTLVRLIETENPTSAIIFCNTKANVHYIASILQGFGYSADELSADLSQNRREQVLRRLRKDEIRFLVATDVAARGIDIPNLSHVFLYETPEDREAYIHRAGRTGRAGAAGTVITLVDIMQKLELQRIAKFYKIDIEALPAPTDEEVAKVTGLRVTALLEAKRRLASTLEIERAKRFLPLVKELTKNAIENGDTEQLLLLALILDGDYQKSLGHAIPQKMQYGNLHHAPIPRPKQVQRGRKKSSHK